MSTALNSTSRLLPWLARVALITATALAPLVGMLLLARRLAGQLDPLPGGLLVMIGVSTACLVLAWRLAWRSAAWQSARAVHAAIWWPPTVLALLAISLSIPDTHPLALVIFWGLLIGEEIWAGMSRRAPTSIPVREAAPAEPPSTDLPAGVSQQIMRTIEGATEQLMALSRVTFAANQQNETVHIAFCPPLEGKPSAQPERLDGPECEIKVAALETYGARLEIKRRGSSGQAAEAVIKLTVTANVEEAPTT